MNGSPVNRCWNHRTFVKHRFGSDLAVDKRGVHVAGVGRSLWMIDFLQHLLIRARLYECLLTEPWLSEGWPEEHFGRKSTVAGTPEAAVVDEQDGVL